MTYAYKNYLKVDLDLITCPCDICVYTDNNASEFPCCFCNNGVTLEQYRQNKKLAEKLEKEIIPYG